MEEKIDLVKTQKKKPAPNLTFYKGKNLPGKFSSFFLRLKKENLAHSFFFLSLRKYFTRGTVLRDLSELTLLSTR